MKKYLIALLLVCSSYLSAAGWSTAGTIPLGSSGGAEQDVMMAYYPKLKQVVAAWVNIHDTLPYYSVYNGTGWSPGQPFLLTNTITAETNVTLQSFPKLQIIVAAWGDTIFSQSYYSIFNGTSWTTPAFIDPLNTFPVKDQVRMTYDKLNNRIIAAWGETSYPNDPIYAILAGSTVPTLAWSGPGQISMGCGTTIVNDNVNIIYNKVDQVVVAIWPNAGFIPGTSHPAYATFDAASSPSFPVAWSTTDMITITSPQPMNVFDDIQLVTAPGVPDILAFWVSNDGSYTPPGRPPMVSVFNGSTFSNGLMFNGDNTVPCFAETPSGGLDNIGGENIDSSEIFNAWACQFSATPVYTITTLPSTVVGGAIPQGSSVGVMANVNLKYDQKSGQMIAAWVDSATNALYYNFYQ